ncbi:protein draper-like [Drosophila innubila]|uniref:protein draper-like n=1 Tax=Drosophila innubila TaxID=198719 RepID=UPI00148D397C|nr:protein draper-like [Drosophila innubila]
MLLQHYIMFSLFPSLMLAKVCKKTERKDGKSITRWDCCDGYRLVNNSGSGSKCDPVCNNNCENGKCVSPNTCSCNEGYDNIQHNPANSCVPVCKRKRNNGECVTSESSKCNDGYKLNESTGECYPVCSNDCPNGRCESPGNCICNQGYSKNETQMDLGCQPVCEVECDDNRVCVAPNKCDCIKGYFEKNNECCPKGENIPISNTSLQECSRDEVKPSCVISFLRNWMIEFAVGLVSLTILIMAVLFLFLRHNRTYDVASREKERPIYVMDNEFFDDDELDLVTTKYP